MQLLLCRHEIRRCGVGSVAAPLVAGAALGAGVAVSTDGAGTPGAWAAGAALSLVAGLATAAGLSREPLVELHLTLPTPYRTTVGRRLLMLVGSAAIGALALAASAHGESAATAAHVAGLTTLLLAVAAWACVALPSAGAASGAVIGAWLGVLLVLDRLAQGSIGVAVFVALATLPAVSAHRALGDPERLLPRGAS